MRRPETVRRSRAAISAFRRLRLRTVRVKRPCGALAGHRLDAAGATAETDDSHSLQTPLPCPTVDGRVLNERAIRCVECRLVWHTHDTARWRAVFLDFGPDDVLRFWCPECWKREFATF